MIEGLKPYPEYKESGLPWLDAIPAHWQTARNGNLFQQRNDTRHPDLPVLEVSLRTGVRVREFGSSKRKQVMSDAGKYKRAAAGDIAYNMMRMWQGAVGVAPVDGLVSPAYGVARPFPGTQPRYYVSLFRNGVYMCEIDAASRGIVKDRNRLYWDQFKQMKSLAPPPEEQAAIVRFLDHANRKIDGFIRAKRKLIGLLNEQKQAIIHQAVTRGLNPDVPLKLSGNRWFPDVPLSWKVIALRRVISAAIDGPHFSPDYLDSGIPFLSARNIRPDKWLLDNAKYISESNYRLFCRRVKPEVGDVLYTKGGTTGVARAVDLQFPFQVWVHIAVLKLDHRLIDPEYLAYCLNSPRCYEQSQLFTRGATNQDLGLGRMKQIELPLPPTVAEQIEIVRWLKIKLGSYNTAIARTEREITLVQEYRTRLTADIVTGKLDVREAAAKLPDTPATDLPFEADVLDEGDILDDTDEQGMLNNV